MEVETYGTEVAALGTGQLFLIIGLSILSIIAMWKIFTKAGHPGWASIVPFYNTMVLCDIGGKPMWWILLLLIPFVNIVVGILVMVGVAKNFGRGVGTALGLLFLPFIFMLILGFGSAEYNKIEA